MTANSQYPGFVDIAYHSPWGNHHMQLCTTQWDDSIVVSPQGSFLSWTGTPRDADDMIKDLANKLKVFFQPDHFLDSYTIYTMASPTSRAIPVRAGSLNIEGTEASSHWAKAVQTTFSIRTSDFGQMKLILLDAPQPGSFDKISSFDASPEAVAVIDELASSANAWSGRDGARPYVLSQITYTLNEKLRREYGMV